MGAWTIMAASDLLAIVELAVVPSSSQFDLIFGIVATSLRYCLEIALFVTFSWPDRGGYIRLGDDVESGPRATNNAATTTDTAATTAVNGSSAQNRNKTQGRKKISPKLQKSVSDEIRSAGGRWKWMKKFRIFLPWIWPSGLPWMKVRIIYALVVLGLETLLSLYIPYVHSAFVKSVVQAYADRDLIPVWKALAQVVVVEFANSDSGRSAVRQLLWDKFKLSREEEVRKLVHEHLMGHEAAFHNSADPTDISTAIEKSNQVCSALDFLVFFTTPQVLRLFGAGATVWSLYGPHVALVLGTISALDLLLVLRSNRTLMVLMDRGMTARFETNRLCQGGLRGWSTVAMYGQIGREVEAYTTGLGAQTKSSWQNVVTSLGFGLGLNLLSSFGTFAATALVVAHGFQTGNTVGPVVAFAGYMALLQSPLRFLTRIPERLYRDLYNADHLRRLLEMKPKMKYGSKVLNLIGGAIEFKNVTFGYPSADGVAKMVLKNFNLVIKKGKTTAFVGPSGSGKSTIINLVTGSYDHDEGSVQIDGQDIRELEKGE